MVMFFFSMLTGTVSQDADLERPIDIFAIGFEEIVDLNASNIVSVRKEQRLYFLESYT